jgi:hypothetical protein
MRARESDATQVPTVYWAQRRDRIFLKFDVKDCVKESVAVVVERAYPVETLALAQAYVGTSHISFTCDGLCFGGACDDAKESIVNGDFVCEKKEAFHAMKGRANGETVVNEGKENVNASGSKRSLPATKTGDDDLELTTASRAERTMSETRMMTENRAIDANARKQKYAISLELYNSVLSHSCAKITTTDKSVFVVLFKPKETTHWPRLLATREKFRHIKTDFDAWKDEDDEVAEKNKFTFDANKMLRIDQYEDAELFDDISSDDEDMPDLTEML